MSWDGSRRDFLSIWGDMELAGAVWQNLLGARGAQAIVYPDTSRSNLVPHFRRSVNLVGGEVVDVSSDRERSFFTSLDQRPVSSSLRL